MERIKAVLIAEDDHNDQLLLRSAFDAAGVNHPVIMVQDGQEAIDYINGHSVEEPPSCLVLTDLKMPRVSGFELLEWLQGQPRLCQLPVIVMSSSDVPSDQQRALSLGARAYLVKPTSFHHLIELVRNINKTWIEPHCPTGPQPA